jgi:hypothetical protein
MRQSLWKIMRNRLERISVLAGIVSMALITPAGATGPQVEIQNAKSVFSSSSDVHLWMMLRNATELGCTPFLIDPVIATESPSSDHWPPRPLSVVTLRIHDKDGKEVHPRTKSDPKAAALQVHELVILHCGESYGWEMWLERIPWIYHLSEGRYMLQATIRVPMTSFLKNRDSLKNQLETLWGDWVRTCIRDVELESNEVQFTVASTK